MKKLNLTIALGIAFFLCAITSRHASSVPATGEKNLELGNFSLSLTVKNVAESKAFYEKLGFHVSGGNGKSYVIMQNATATIGLYHGMFPKNMLTFNPGWDRNKNVLPEFDDVREIQKTIKARGLTPTSPADENSTDKAYMMIDDPDGNPILIDQHIPAPKK